tara:strand:- start:774 stop:1604 length:831 start_codon:yes stop_codon:yes gene_type:complete
MTLHTRESVDAHKRATGITPMPPAMRKAFDRKYPGIDSYRSWYEEGVEWALTWLTRHGSAVPEGCTPADARVLREANHQMAEELARVRDQKTLPRYVAESMLEMFDLHTELGTPTKPGQYDKWGNALAWMAPCAESTAPVQCAPAVQNIEAALTALKQTNIRHMNRREIVEVVLATASAATAAARDVLAERQRQIDAEGWTPEHDDEHGAGEMAAAAGCYAFHAALGGWPDLSPYLWPWDKAWWKPTTPRRNLVKAGALILAEIERLDRAADREGS